MRPEVRKNIIIRDMYTCQRCGKHPSESGLQIAHRIKSGSGSINYIREYLRVNHNTELSNREIDEEILCHPLNLVATCSLRCNDSFNIFFNEVERDRLLRKICKINGY